MRLEQWLFLRMPLRFTRTMDGTSTQSKARAFRSVVRDTIWTDEETYTVNATYVEDGTGLLSQNGSDC